MTMKPVWAAAGLALGGALVLGSISSKAADVYEQGGGLKDAPFVAPVTSWTGFYVGGHLGGAWSDGSASVTEHFFCAAVEGDTPCTPPPPKTYHKDLSGWGVIGGVHAGYNLQRGHTVFGVEGDVSFGDKIDYLASARARLGWAEDNWLFYATGGAAFIGAGEKGSITIPGGVSYCGPGGCPPPTGPLSFAYDTSEHEVGYVVGGGVETKLRHNLSVGVEGLYYGFDGSTFKHGTVDQVAAQGISEVAVVRGRVSLHLDREPEPLK